MCIVTVSFVMYVQCTVPLISLECPIQCQVDLRFTSIFYEESILHAYEYVIRELFRDGLSLARQMLLRTHVALSYLRLQLIFPLVISQPHGRN